MIKLENVSKYYHNEGIVTLGLRKINLDFKIGEFIAITGESGSGKSTLLNIISGIDTYEEGEIYINGQETSHYDDNDWEEYRKNEVAFIFQNYNLIDSYSVLKNVEVALVIQGFTGIERRRTALKIIEKVGLTSHIKHKASKLSGGQKQRLAIARALAKETKIIVADEPTGNLDSDSGNQILKLLNEISKDRLVIIVTHNYEQAEPYVTRKIRLFDGEVVEDKEFKKIEKESFVHKDETQLSSFNKVSTISFFSLLSQPKKTTFLLIVSLATVLFIFFIYGSILSIGEGNSFDDQINSYPERVIVKRSDYQPLTDSDYQKLSSLSEVQSIIKEDKVLDIRFGMNTSFLNGREFSFLLPMNDFKEKDILGRMPEADDEILLSTYFLDSDKKQLESFLNNTYSFSFFSKDGYSSNLQMKFKIVGFHKSNEQKVNILITDNAIKNLYSRVIINNENNPLYWNGNTLKYSQLIPDDSLEDNEIIFPMYDIYGINTNSTLFFNNEQVKLIIDTKNDDNLYVSKNVYDSIKNNTKVYQWTLNLKDANKADGFINDLFDLGYYSYSPYLSQKSSIDAVATVFLNIFKVVCMVFAAFVIYLISYLTIKTIMDSKTKDYSILRTMGLEKSLLKNIVRFEVAICFVFSFIVFFILYLVFKNDYPMLLKFTLKDIFWNAIINFALAFLISRKFIKLLVKKSIFSSLRIVG